jgi:hypothetical protein
MIESEFMEGREAAARDLEAEAGEIERQYAGTGPWSQGLRTAAVLREAARIIRERTRPH